MGNNNRRIVVLNDGETWTESGYVVEVTDKAYEEICDGRKVKHMLGPGDGVTIIDWINEPPVMSPWPKDL
jgi:hypothetical protein